MSVSPWFQVFSQFLYDDHIKSMLMKESRAVAAAASASSKPAGRQEGGLGRFRAAGGLLRTSTRPTLNPLRLLLLLLPLLLLLLRASVCAYTLEASHVPILAECLFSMTLLRGSPSCDTFEK